MWFFSQVLFSLKREGEFNVLLALGAIVDEVRRQLICYGLLSAACSLVMLLAMMSVSSCAVCFAGNAITVFTMKTPVRFIFHMPWIPAAVGLVLGFACAFLSCYIPFILYKRRVDIISVTDPAEI